ncbi:arsenical pump membrane protein [Exophiala viscosa]|uniref:Arsenical pump membrane protein n=1 Tax=Exophiala viscosa TaxID=2486360 RepID=A0AAN6DZP9_9EURO|nr:arsenical pump membrane protein [Exophiala viscosa]KAI1621604.1 arsenical pump membrane protein [Exophiala viscosa]
MSDGGQQDHLNGHSAFILAVFCIVSIFVIWPVRIPLPRSLQRVLLATLRWSRIISHRDHDLLAGRRLYFSLSLKTAPVIAVILLLATTTIHGSTIKLGIKGDDSIKPYDVLVLFISLAYISIALDGTGALEAVALWVSKRGGSSGRLLFTYLYSFFLVTACIVGNDPLILSGTPFLAYLTQHTQLEPEAWIFSEFMAANTASAVLVSSNPTNILIAGSFSLNYLTDFTKWTILPSIIPAILTYPILMAMFRKKIPKILTPLQDNPWLKLRDRTGAIVLSSLMLVTVAVLVGTSFVPGHAVEVWMVTMPAGILAFLFNIISDIFSFRKQKTAAKQQSADPSAETDGIRRAGVNPTEQHPLGNSKERAEGEQESSPSINPEQQKYPEEDGATFMSVMRTLASRFPGTTRTLARLPIPLLPFAMCEFILVRGLQQRGWIAVFARGFANACTTPAKTVFFMGFVSAAFLCPLAGTNIGATIILVEIMRDSAFSGSPPALADPRILLAAIYSVAMGSNIGAFSYTFAGSLAGLLWRELLADKGIKVSQLKFALVNALPLLMQITTASAIVLGEVYWFS